MIKHIKKILNLFKKPDPQKPVPLKKWPFPVEKECDCEHCEGLDEVMEQEPTKKPAKKTVKKATTRKSTAKGVVAAKKTAKKAK